MKVIDTTPGHIAIRCSSAETIHDTTLVAALLEHENFSREQAEYIVEDLLFGLESLSLATA